MGKHKIAACFVLHDDSSYLANALSQIPPDIDRIAFVEEQIEQCVYGTASEFVRALIREAQTKKERERIDALLLAGLNSGAPIEATPEYWQEKLKRLKAKQEDIAS